MQNSFLVGLVVKIPRYSRASGIPVTGECAPLVGRICMEKSVPNIYPICEEADKPICSICFERFQTWSPSHVSTRNSVPYEFEPGNLLYISETLVGAVCTAGKRQKRTNRTFEE